MRRILLLISFIFSGFIASAQTEYISDRYHPFLTAPQKVCAGAYASMHAWLQDIDDSDHDKRTVDSVRWTIDMPVSPNFVYSKPRGASPLVRWIANNSESITFNINEVGTYTVTARVYFTRSGSARYVDVTKTIIAEDCTMDECEGTYSPATNFKETFGTFTVNENPRPLDPPATIGYNYDGDGELVDDYYSIHYSARIGGKNEWGDVFDHTNDGYGGMLIANSSEEPRLFYSRTVTGLCPGAKYNFSAWFINLNSLGVINSICESWNGSYQYAGVTFIVRNADNNAIIGQFNTNDVSMDLSRENGGDQRMTGWQKFGGTVTLGPGVQDVIVEIRNNNPGGCGNDIAVDDIEFSFCAPKIYSYIDGLGVTSDMVCPGAELTLTSVIQPADYFTDPVYRWEFSKNGAPYETINEAGYTGINTPTLGIGPDVLQEGDVIRYQLMVIEAGNLAADERQCYTPSNFVMLEVASLPTINATRDVLCRGDSTILTASPLEAPGVTGYETFTWTGPDILPWPATEIQPKNQILIRPQVTSEYGVTGTITYGQYQNGQPRVCTKKDSLIITVDQPPVVELGPDMLLCVNTPVTLDAGAANAGYDITWQPGNLHTQAINITAPSTPATQEYKVNIQNGQCTTRDSVKLTSVRVTEAVIDGITEYCTDVTPTIKLKPDHGPDPGAVPPETVTWSFVGDSHGATLFVNNPTGAPNDRRLLNMPFNIPVTVRMTMQVTGTDCISTDEKTFIVETQPNAAARSLAQCTNVFTLDADPVKDTSMTGTWSVISGDVTIDPAEIHNPAAIATITGGPQTAVLRWTVVKNRPGSACPPRQVDITLSYAEPATISVEPSVEICRDGFGYFVLPWTSANNPEQYDLEAVGPNPMPGFMDIIDDPVYTTDGDFYIFYPSDVDPGSYTFRIRAEKMTMNGDVCFTESLFTLTINTPSVAPTISLPTPSICTGSSATLTLTGGTLGSNTEWVWYEGNCVTGTEIARGVTSITVSPTATTTYSVRAEGITGTTACGNSSCVSSTVTVYQMPADAVAGPDQENCDDATFIMNADAPSISGAQGTWTASPAGVTISDIHDRNATVTVPAGITATLTWTVTNGPCIAVADQVILTNRVAIGNNVIEQDQIICPGDQPNQLLGVGVPTGGDGTYTYEWEYSITGAASGFQPVASATGSIFQPPLLTQTTWYRRIVRSGTECANTSNAVEITVSTDPPTVTGTPPPVTTACATGADYTTLFGTPTFSHPLGLTLTITQRDSTAVQTCGITITRIWTATDPCGKTATTQQTITVTDNTAPVFATAAPADVTVECGNIPSFDDIAVTDECSAVDYDKSEQTLPIAGACVNSYQIVRTWTATDACGNETVLTQTITVIDTEPPVFDNPAPANAIVECSAIPVQPPLTATDNCSGSAATVTTRQDTVRTVGDCLNNYQLRRVWIATDVCGNEDSVIQIITVQDTQPPVFDNPAPANAIVECSAIPVQPPLTATDNCNGSVTITTRQDTVRTVGDCLNNYQLRRVWIATDVCGNEDSVIQIITVQDTQPPVFDNPAPANAIVECSAIPVQPPLTATDNCNGSVTVTTRQDTVRTVGDCLNNYQLRRVWIATDVCGNEDSVIQIITVQDTQPPVFDNPAPANAIVECSAIPVQPTLTATDNCNGSVTVTTRQDTVRTVGDCLNNYQLRRVWIATDVCGNEDSVIQIITVQDTQPPVFDSPAPANATVECDAIPIQSPLTATDNCNGSVTITTRQDTVRTVGDCLNNYQLRRVWIATDVCGNEDSVIQIITVQDTQPPVFDNPAPANATVECDAIPVQPPLTATDNCNGSVTVTTRQDTVRTVGDCLNNYQLRRVWIATDVCGNEDSVIQIITVQDTQPPVFDNPAPANAIVECSAIPVQPPLTATDNCNGSVTITTRQDTVRTVGDCLNNYQLRRVWIATDVCGNEDSVIQIITVQDTQPPVFDSPAPTNTTVECDAIPVQPPLTATDNCNGSVTITTRQDTVRTVGDCLNNYQLRRVWIATDVCGNEDSVIQIITVQDTQPPVFDNPAPANATVECDAIPVQPPLTATDNCNGSVTITTRQDTVRTIGDCLNNYQLRRVWIATDVCGNEDSVIQIITVQDTQPPVFDSPAPANATVECDAIPIQPPLTATDNCNGATTITTRQDTVRTVGDCLNNYQLRRVWIATDVCGNEDSVIQIITVQDTQPPVFDNPAPANATVECDAIPVQLPLTATDNCNGSVTITTRQDTVRAVGDCLNNYQLRRVWIATDVCGNEDSVIQIITVQDTQPPVFDNPAPANATVECDAIPVQPPLTATDNCNGSVTITTRQDTVRTVGDCLNNYQLRRVWIATDVCGNEDSVIQIITVQDTQPPVFDNPAPANAIVECSAIPVQPPLTATDNCNGATTITTRQDTVRTVGDCLNNYQLRRVWIATDVCGNEDSVIQIITVQDTQPPVFDNPAPANAIVECSAIPVQPTLTATDNCNGSVTVTTRQDTVRTVGDCLNNYQLRRVWIATDVCGNEDSVIQIITVQDTQPPVFDNPAPANAIVECSAIPVQPPLTATDNCNGSVTITTRQDTVRTVGDCLNNYQLRRVWIATDVCGNEDSVIQIITVQDTQPPVFDNPAPANAIVECSAIPVQPTLTATDNCNGSVTITTRQDTVRTVGDCLNNYQLRRVWIATDVCGNEDSVIQIITVQDTQPPIFDNPAPANAIVECSAIPVQPTLTATDNCNGSVTVTTRQDTVRTVGDCLNNYQLRRVWIATDVCGNEDSVIQIITVQDTQPPVFDNPAPANAIVECSAIPVQPPLTATDNCNGSVTITTRQDTVRTVGDCLNNYQLRRVWIATDVCGNEDSVIQIITVQDTQPPVFDNPAPANAIVECSAIPVQPTLTATDNCNGSVTITTRQDTVRTVGDCLNNYQLRRVWIATDVCGNEDSVIQIITVQDTQPPIFDNPAPANAIVECSAIPVQPPLTATDNCNGSVTITTRQDTVRTVGDCLNNYQLRRVWIATDVCGNEDSVIQIITVQDTQPPVFDNPAPANAIVECSAIPVQPALTATDNCNGSVTITTRQDTVRTVGDCLNNYQLRRVWIATDVCGNEDSVIQIITVQDTQPPVFDSPAPANATVECDAIPVQSPLTATDNCNGSVTITTRQDTVRTVGDCLNNYQLRRVWIATDVCGNEDSVIQIITVQDTQPPVFDNPAPANATVECDAIPIQPPLTATDNCNGATTITTRQDTVRTVGDCLNNYQLRRVWIATDVCGNEDSVIQIITVQDTQPPVFDNPAPANATVECDAIPIQPALTATDNCNGATTITTRQDTVRTVGDCLNNYQLRRVWIATDVCGNEDSVIQIITVQDTQPPVFDNPAPANATVECDAIPVQPPLTATDNCNGSVTITTRQDTVRTVGDCLNNYQLRRVWIATDVCGNEDSVIQIITVQDTQPPVFDNPAPANAIVECSAIPVQPTLTATDNCNGSVTVTTRQDTVRTVGDCLNNYQLRRVWIATDVCGNEDSVIQIITVQDTQPPVFDNPAPANAIVECSAIPVQPTLTATDNCNGSVTVTTRQDTVRTVGDCLNNYQLRRVWIATDVCGNEDSVIQIITVQDTQPPVFDNPAPANTIVECSAIPVQPALTATDNCNGTTTITTRQDTVRTIGDCLNNYQLRRVWIATDVCGNRDSVIQIITVQDTQPPVFNTPAPVNVTVECDAIPVQPALNATDNCNGLVTVITRQDTVRTTGDCINNYRLRRVWIATDVCGNRDSVIQIITVQDTQPPVFNTPAPANVTVECDAIPIQGDLTASDNCNGLVTVSKRQDTVRAPGACISNYQLRRVWTAVDACGNRDSVIQIITVRDTKPPVFTTTAPADTTVECSAIPDQIDLQATDLCSPAGTVRILENQTRQNLPGACANNYLLIRTWTALDACNNATTVTQTITVVDRTAPVFTSAIPANVTVECDNIPGVPDMTARDNCSATNKVTIGYNETRENIPGACVNNYRLRRTWTATDECGNFTTAVQIITVQDTKPPVFTAAAPANVTVECDAVPDQPDMTATDNCSGIVNITKAQQRFDSTCANTYRLVRTWTATDVCGNSTTLTQTIIVADRTKPVFSTVVPRDTIVNCDAIPLAPVMTATDNCAAVVNISYNEQHVDIPGACTNNYKLLRSWTANDGCGNTTLVIQVITVQDTTKPVFTLPIPANVTVNCDAIPAQPDLTASDNCSPAAGVTVTKAQRRENIPGACVNNYRLVRTWTAKDVCGNTAIATQIITVQDTTRPVFTLPVPVDVTVECNAIPTMPNLTATDNCSAASRVTITRAERTEPIPGACVNNYRLIRTWTAKDECGNSTTLTQVITVTDTTAPSFTMPVPTDATVDCNNIPAQPQLTATDNCSATNRITVTRSQRREDIPGACVNNYRLIRTWTATDECGNARTVSQTITVQDTTRPAFTVSVPMDATVECSAIPVMPDLNVTDNCTPSNRVTVVKAERREDIPGACANNYRLIRTWTATDECGNSHMVQQVLTVTDRTPPAFTIATPANATVECDAIPVQPDLSATDNCSMANNVSVVKAERRENIPGACANNYRLVRTWTATDECGNSRTVQQVLTVVDRTPPVFTTTVPANITAECDAIPAMPDLAATDNCSPMNVRIVKDEVRENIPGACANNYRLIRTWTATDECGNSTVIKQTVTVEDRTAPVFTLQPPTNITVNCDEVPAAPVMTATDNCSGNNVTVRYSFTKRQLSGECISNYRLTRTWVATDECGNRAIATQVITVIDTTRPVFNMAAPGDTTVSCDAIPSPISISASDNCSLPGAVRVTFNQQRENIPGACASNYRLIYTWMAVDECGNTAVMRQVITVQDTTRPVIDAPPADITLNCGQGIPTDMIELNATDNCDGSFPKKVKYTIDPYTPDLCNGYTITRRWSVTDECGNAADDVVQRIIVLPCPKPELQADVFTNCSSMPFITLKTNGRVNRPVYTLVGVTPANAVRTPVTSSNPMFNVNGATTASFVVRDGLTGCVSDTMTYTINYLDMPVVNLGADTSLCGGNGMVLDAGPANFGYNISWSTGETTQRIRVTQAGTYKVTVSNGMCTATDSIVVSVIPMPLIDIPDTTICRGQSVTLDATVEGASSYFWSTGDNTPSINVSTQERFWVQVIKNGCITIDTIDVTVNPPPDITLSRDTTICPGQTVMLTVNTSAGRIMWGTGEEGNSILVSRAGTYSVAVYRDNCVVRESVRVAERPNMDFELGPDRIMCPGGSIIVDARNPDAATYRWNDGDLNPVKSISVAGVYKLGILDRFCDRYQEDSIKVTIAGPPTLNLGNDTIICKGRRHILKANAVNATAYQWSNGATTSYIEVSEPGTYSVTVFNDCGSATDEITIDVKECDSKPEMPNAFSPNGDGKNDVFRPQVRGPMYDYELRVFNRWGELVYLSKDQYEGWDGTYKGRPVDIGTFVWWLTYKKVTNGPAFIIKGDVTVVR